MWISDLSIRRPVFAVMLIAALVGLGAVSVGRLGVNLYPDVDRYDQSYQQRDNLQKRHVVRQKRCPGEFSGSEDVPSPGKRIRSHTDNIRAAWQEETPTKSNPSEEAQWRQTVRIIQKKLSERNISITLSDNAKAYIAEAGFDPVYGARPLKRALYEVVEDRLAELILEDKVVEGSSVSFDVVNGEIEVDIS